MSTFLSPGVFTREIDISTLPSNTGALRPAFVGTAKKGPLNTPTLITSASDFIEIFGEPFTESYLGYAVIAYLAEGNSAWVLRVGIEHSEGLDSDLQAIAIDTSGAKVEGWGRIPIFKGIDHGVIEFRKVSSTQPIIIHADSIADIEYNDAVIDGTNATDATLTFSSTGTLFTGCVDEIYTMSITGDPVGGDSLDGATYSIIDSSGDEVKSGTLVASGTDASAEISISGTGIAFTVDITSGDLGENDTFTFRAIPDNSDLTVEVEGVSETIVIVNGTYNTADEFVTAINDQSPSNFEAFTTVDDNGDEVPAIRTTTSGERIQATGTCAFCAEVGISQYSWDIPRSYLIGTEEGPYTISTDNNRIVMDVVKSDETIRFDFSIPTASAMTVDSLASVIDANGVADATQYFESFVITVPGGTEHVVVAATTSNKFNQLILKSDFTYLQTLRLSDTLGINYPYTNTYRTFSDSRVTPPDPAVTDPSTPDSCDDDPLSTQCSLDTSYYANIVGYFVAKYPGTWINNYTLSLEPFTEGVGDSAGLYKITIKDLNGVSIDVVQNVSFDSTHTRYISNVVNDGGTIAGINGNQFYQWEPRPDTIGAGEDRRPSFFVNGTFSGGANGIPEDAGDSLLLDSAVIGNAGLSTGIFALQNPEAYDFNLLMIPGFSSGPVIASAIQFCENRGDALYIIDPPFGLRPQQVVDWHNGMLTSDLASAVNSSYAALYWSWIKVSDTFNGGTIWIPPCGDVAAIYAKTARERESWIAPAGLQRGRLNRVLNTEYDATLGERDLMYGSGNAVNPLVNFPQEGTVIWGQRTLQRSDTALDRVNVRMLMIYLKKNLQQVLRNFVFEPNDEFTRAQIRDTINPFLGDVAARRGVTAYNVVVDESNNTPERIDRNELWVSVFVKPTRAAEFVVLNLVVLKTGQNFAAQEVLAAGGVVVE